MGCIYLSMYNKQVRFLDESLYDLGIHSHVAPKPVANRITYSQTINAYLIWARDLISFGRRAPSHLGTGTDFIWVWDSYRFRPSAKPMFHSESSSFSKYPDATNHSNC